MAAKMLVRYRTKMLKRPEEIQDVSFFRFDSGCMDRKRAILMVLISFLYGYSCLSRLWRLVRRTIISVYSLSFVVLPANIYPVYIHYINAHPH